MGTRSLLGYETAPGKVYYQYMQFDGYPTCKGREFYEGIAATLGSVLGSAATASPLRKADGVMVRQRIRHFLDNYQYASGHSVNNHDTCTRKAWDAFEVDGGQEWQYLWDTKGNFIGAEAREHGVTFTIPWELTSRLYESHHHLKLGRDDTLLEPWWKALHNLAMADEATLVPSLELRAWECNEFPEQGDAGWRHTSALSVNNKKVFTDMFGDSRSPRRRNQAVAAVGGAVHEALTCGPKRLPTLLASEYPGVKEIVERRLRKGR